MNLFMEKEMAKIEDLIHCTRLGVSSVISGTQVSDLDYKCGDPPMAAFTGLVLSSCNSFPLSETCLPSGEGGKLLGATVFKHHCWEVTG